MLIFLLLLLLQPAASDSLQQGLLALRDGNLTEAKVSFESALKSEPKNAFAWVSLAEVCRRQGDDATALDAAAKAEQFGSDIPTIEHALASFYSQTGQLAHAAKLEEKFAASAKADTQASLRTAELYERSGDIFNAERILKAAWEPKKADSEVAFRYSQLLLHKLDFVGAENVVTPALAAEPKDPQLVLVIGVAHYGERRFPEAIDDFLKVIAIDPTIPQPYGFIGKMMEHTGPKLAQITAALEARTKSAPNDPLANLVLAKVKLITNSKDPAAETLLQHSLEIDPEQWEAHFELGVLLEAKHDFNAAADELKKSIALDPKQATPHYHLARIYDRLGDPEHAAAERKLNEELSAPK